MDRLLSKAGRGLFLLAAALAVLAVAERLANSAGYRLAFVFEVTPSRLLELAGITLLFVISIQLGELRQSLSSGASRGG